jgi:isopentenyl-diphosphate Delta-isomerase
VAEELYDVLDEQGNKTGQILPKSEVHDKELWHASVFIWIYNSKGEILLQRRAKDKKSFPDKWDVSVAGHMTAGDKPIEAAVREIEEEIGVKVTAKELVPVEFMSVIVPWLPDKKHPEFCWIYILYKELDPHKLSIQKKELTAVKLQLVDDLQEALKHPADNVTYADRRNPLIYETAFSEIKKRLNDKRRKHEHA